jgi:hypothetical protein
VQARNAQALDPRVIEVSIQVNGRLNTYSQLAITASGTKYANALQNECELTIYNLDKATQDYLLTETSPYNLNRTPKLVIIKAGRQSYGTALIYTGNIIYSKVTQPPDIGITLKSLTGNFLKGNILSRSYASGTPLSVISNQLAMDTQTALQFQATNKNIGNYSYSGSLLNQVGHLAGLGNYNVFIDNNTLVVKDGFVPLTGVVRILDAQSGMIGIPEFTEQGIRVKFLLDNRTTLGGALDIRSTIYPAANGLYVIYKLGFEIATRDTPFYWIAEAARLR